MLLRCLSIFILILSIIYIGCHKKDKTLFTKLEGKDTGITFKNELTYTEDNNCFTYRAFFNGGGVGLGDINNDGLTDVFFCSNQSSSKLYLNKGNFKFEDITDKAGVACKGVWATGVAMADVNGDGLLDIYVCKSGQPTAQGVRYNELFINNGNLTFSEKAKEYGLDDEGLSSHAAFFDFDKDGDLDCYLLNNSLRSVANYDKNSALRNVRDTLGGNKLYRNEGGKFKDISRVAGIFGSSIGFGLGVTIGDIDRDGWQDIYVSNDFFERDYLYINNKNGTFTEALQNSVQEISMGSMGADMADINNDGFPEIFVTEMLPEKDARLKTKASFDTWNKYQQNITNGYHRQFPRNVLQLNNGNKTFSEIGRLSGVAATDWSWGALIADWDNDGFKDIFVANGIYKDLFDQDYQSFMSDPNNVRSILMRGGNGGIKKLVDTIPSEAVPNYIFQNNKDLTFTNKAQEWGLGDPSFSNGSAYADLDNDGDLDLVINNVNMEAFVYRNESTEMLKENKFLTVILRGVNQNTAAFGSQVTVFLEGKQVYQEVAPMRGFQSCVDTRLYFGLGKISKIDSVVVDFPSDKRLVLKDVQLNSIVTINEKDAVSKLRTSISSFNRAIFTDLTPNFNLNFKHIENDFNDFDIERLLFHMNSTDGPKMCKGDVNGDKLDDFFIGNAQGSTGVIFIQTQDGRFNKTNQAVLEKDKMAEDTGCTFFDVDGDKDLDLYVCSGGSDAVQLGDRLYLNDGKGNFTKSEGLIAADKPFASSCVRAADYDNDGDQDLFVGARLIPSHYGAPMGGFILQNDGKGHFKGVTPEVAPELKTLGMVCDAIWCDIDNDKDLDLLVVGEWIPLSIFKNEGGKLLKINTLAKSNGWWNCIKAGDFNGDGLMDFVVGNHGLNSRFKASETAPLSMFVNDFDDNGMAEPIICGFNGGQSYPMVLRQDIVSQMPSLKKKYLYFKNYKEQKISDIFAAEKVQKALKYEAFNLKSSILINKGNGQFEIKDLPIEAQLSPVFGIAVEDFDKDGKLDIALSGNFSRSKPEVGTYLANYGTLLRGDGQGNFQALKNSGFKTIGEGRDLLTLKTGNKNLFISSLNNDSSKLFSY
jgi:enediyne biosynthesis protein E4